MPFLHVRFGSVSVLETELLLTCSVRFGQNGKTLLRSVTTIHRVKNAGNFPKVLKKPLCNDLANAKDQSISDQYFFSMYTNENHMQKLTILC